MADEMPRWPSVILHTSPACIGGGKPDASVTLLGENPGEFLFNMLAIVGRNAMGELFGGVHRQGATVGMTFRLALEPSICLLAAIPIPIIAIVNEPIVVAIAHRSA